MKTRRRFGTKTEINVVPLLDVLLVLLLIFMATAPIINQSVEVDLPQSAESEEVSTTTNKPVIVEVSQLGTFSLLFDQERFDNLSNETLIEEIKLIIEKNPNAVFLIGGEKTVVYDEIIHALNLLKTAGVKSVGLMTQAVD